LDRIWLDWPVLLLLLLEKLIFVCQHFLILYFLTTIFQIYSMQPKKGVI